MELKDTVLGIELGSTRIKAVLVDRNFRPLVSSSFAWENQLVDGVWTYAMDQVYQGLRTCYADLKRQVQQRFGQTIRQVGAIGVSGMMHGYLPFDAQGNQLAQFRTWRNTMTEQAAEELNALFGFNIPQRWSIAHLYQAMLNGEPHVKEISFLTTLAGFLHWKLTGEKRMGVGEASGMFPIGRGSCAYDKEMVHKFDALAAEMGYSWTLEQILPQPVPAGTPAGILTPEGAALLDPSGDLQPGIPLAPCEGDAGTGMTATNAVRLGTGNVSAGTSDFAMLVTDCKMAVHREIDMVTTPAGIPVAMVHCNNCTSDINAWVSLFEEFAEAIGAPQEPGKLYTLLFRKALEGSPGWRRAGQLQFLFRRACFGPESGTPAGGPQSGQPIELGKLYADAPPVCPCHPENRAGYSDAAGKSGADQALCPRRILQDAGGGTADPVRGHRDACGCYGNSGRGRTLWHGAAVRISAVAPVWGDAGGFSGRQGVFGGGSPHGYGGAAGN